MFNSWKIGRLFGIDFAVHWSFLLLFAFVVFGEWASGAGLAATLLHGLLFGAVFGCVALHELGHAMAARQFGIATRDITLLPIGGVARLERMPEKPLQELWVAVAGPLVNVVIAGIILAATLAFYRPEEALHPFFAWDGWSFFRELMWINVALVAFNMLPAFPMDGGRVLRALLGFVLPFVDATRVAAIVGQGMAVLMGIAGILTGQWMLAILAAFIFFAARGETQGAVLREAYRTLPIGRTASRYFQTLRPESRADEWSMILPRTRQIFFPVMEQGAVIGVVAAEELQNRIVDRDLQATARDLMSRDYLLIDEREPLWNVIEQLQRHAAPICVTRDGRLTGLFGPEELDRALRESKRAHSSTPTSSTPDDSETPPRRRPPTSLGGEAWTGPLPRPLRDSSYPTP